jgi:DNA-binding NarL/FixJ family response regulator
MDKIRVLLASNQELWWEGLLLLLSREEDVTPVDICYNAADTINKVNDLQPDVLLLDEEIKGGDSEGTAQAINQLHGGTKIIIVIKPYKNVNHSTNFKANAKGYIDKDLTYLELLSAIHNVAKGNVVIMSTMMAQKLLDVAEHVTEVKPTVLRVEFDVGLSKREKEVLELLVKKGITNKEISKTLYITENTVKAHLSSILYKMQVRNRQQAIAMAQKHGMTDIDITQL